MMYLDDGLLEQLHQAVVPPFTRRLARDLDELLLRQRCHERVQAAALERLAMAAQRDARAARLAVRPAWRERLAAVFRRRPAPGLRGA